MKDINFTLFKSKFLALINLKIQSPSGEIEGKRCTHISDPTFAKYWENNFLCVPKKSPYHFVWSFRGPVKAKDMSCIKMGIPGGPKEWMDNYLCAKTTTKDEEDV